MKAQDLHGSLSRVCLNSLYRHGLLHSDVQCRTASNTLTSSVGHTSTHLHIKLSDTDCTEMLVVNVVTQPASQHILRNRMLPVNHTYTSQCTRVLQCLSLWAAHTVCRPYSDQTAAMIKLHAMGASNTAEADAVAA